MGARGLFRVFLLLAVASVSLADVKPTPQNRITLLSPRAESVVDGDTCSIELSLPTGSVFKYIEIVPHGNAGRKPRKFLVKGVRFLCDVHLLPGKNEFQVVGVDAKGRRVKGPAFRVFRTSGKKPSAGEAPSPETGGPLPYLQPAREEEKAPAPAAPPAVKDFGPGRCGYTPYQTMSIPVTDAHGTHYVEFKTDGNGCLPPQVEMK